MILGSEIKTNLGADKNASLNPIVSHNIYVMGLLFFVPANATAEWYENEFPQGPLPPERIVMVPLTNKWGDWGP